MKKPLFNKVVIAGVGLMGGSLGLALRKKRLVREVVGLVRRQETIREAMKVGSIDRGTLAIPEALQASDLVVLGCPVSQAPELLTTMLPFIPKGCIVTAQGSTKEVMLKQIAALLPKRPAFSFASSHPMAGSEKAGVAAARADLFDGALCLLIRETWTDEAALKRLRNFWQKVGCTRFLTVKAAEHDALTAAASHLPHATAACLANVVADLSQKQPDIREVAATGFRDTTRVAAGLPGMWADILMTNRKEVAGDLARLQKRIARVIKLLQSGSLGALETELARAREFRLSMESRLPQKSKGEDA